MSMSQIRLATWMKSFRSHLILLTADLRQLSKDMAATTCTSERDSFRMNTELARTTCSLENRYKQLAKVSNTTLVFVLVDFWSIAKYCLSCTYFKTGFTAISNSPFLAQIEPNHIHFTSSDMSRWYLIQLALETPLSPTSITHCFQSFSFAPRSYKNIMHSSSRADDVTSFGLTQGFGSTSSLQKWRRNLSFSLLSCVISVVCCSEGRSWANLVGPDTGPEKRAIWEMIASPWSWNNCTIRVVFLWGSRQWCWIIHSPTGPFTKRKLVTDFEIAFSTWRRRGSWCISREVRKAS